MSESMKERLTRLIGNYGIPENKAKILDSLTSRISIILYDIRLSAYCGFSNEEFRDKMYTICRKPETLWICDWIQNIIDKNWSKEVIIDRLKAGLSNSEGLGILQLREMNLAAKEIIEFLKEHNSYATGSPNNQTEKGKESKYPDEQVQ